MHCLKSQLLDLLLDINESSKIPPRLRFDLRSPTPNESDVPALEPDLGPGETQDVESARAALREARAEFEGGQTSQAEYRETEASLTAMINAASQAPQRLANLSRITHTTLACVPPPGMPIDLIEDSPAGYLDPLHEEEYLANIDGFLSAAPPDAQPALPRHPKPTEREKEKDAQLNNPVSVYNWLRSHSDTKSITQEVEKEPASATSNIPEPIHQKAKPSPKPPSSAGNGTTKPSRKRASSAIMLKQELEEELLDEEGYVIAGGSETPASRGKRKRENDESYRPKGGSSKSRKKTKSSNGAVVKKTDPEIEEDEA